MNKTLQERKAEAEKAWGEAGKAWYEACEARVEAGKAWRAFLKEIEEEKRK